MTENGAADGNKRCGHRPNKSIVETSEMIDRLKIATKTAKESVIDHTFVVMARTDAYANEGFVEIFIFEFKLIIPCVYKMQVWMDCSVDAMHILTMAERICYFPKRSQIWKRITN